MCLKRFGIRWEDMSVIDRPHAFRLSYTVVPAHDKRSALEMFYCMVSEKVHVLSVEVLPVYGDINKQ